MPGEDGGALDLDAALRSSPRWPTGDRVPTGEGEGVQSVSSPTPAHDPTQAPTERQAA